MRDVVTSSCSYDIAIVGAGPAGAMLARLLSPRYSIALIDRRTFSDSQNKCDEKCCGGLLAPDAQRMLAQFGMAIPKSVTADPQLFAVRTFDTGSKYERIFQRSYINIDRQAFDNWLLLALPSSVSFFKNTTIASITQQRDVSELHGFQNGIPFTLQAKVIVGADGARSHIRRFLNKKPPEPKAYIAVQGEFELHSADPYFTAIFAPHLTDFYGWIIPKNGTALAGIALPVNNAVLKSYEDFVSVISGHYTHIGKELRRRGAFIYRPNGFNCHTGNSRIALVGEAAGFISPSSAEGFSFAFKSAHYLAAALNKGLTGFETRYTRYCMPLRVSITVKSMKSPVMYVPWIRRMILTSGIQSL